MIDVKKIQHAAQVAAKIPLKAVGRGRSAIEKPIRDLFYCLEHSPDSQELAIAAAKGMLETESGMDIEDAMKAWPVFDEIVSSTADVNDLLSHQSQVVAAYLMAYRTARGGEDN